MSLLILSRLREASGLKFPTNGPRSDPKTDQSRYSPQLKHLHSDAEPPEEAVRELEAPESWHRCRVEAPDAGRGEPYPAERHFTHGRSRS